jgi:hypothetical protein
MRELYVKDLSEYEIDGMNSHDYPDFCDAFIGKAWDKDGNELTQEELDWLHENDSAGVDDAVHSESNMEDWHGTMIDRAMDMSDMER